MGAGFIVAVAIFTFALVTVWKGVRIVPQGEEWVVEWLGKYDRTLLPGLRLLVPYVQNVRYKIITKDIILDVQEQEVITRDNAVILTNAIAFIKVTDPIKAVYGVTDFSEAIRNMMPERPGTPGATGTPLRPPFANPLKVSIRRFADACSAPWQRTQLSFRIGATSCSKLTGIRLFAFSSCVLNVA